MERFKNILYINDPSFVVETALARAVHLARTNQSRLTVVSVIPEIPRTMVNLQKTFLELQDKRLHEMISDIPTEGVRIRTGALSGIPFVEIIRKVIQGKFDLVIKPAEGRGGVSSFLFGSTDMHLFRKCPCPVWIIKHTKRKTCARILAAVDPDPAIEANAELNALILDLATCIATREQCELHIVHAWALDYQYMLDSEASELGQQDVDELLRARRNQHKEWFDELLGRYDLDALGARTYLLKGVPGQVIPTLARKKRIELIVMGTVARTGIPGFFIGNTAEKTLAAVDCSVLAVKPSTFISPLDS